MDLPGNVTLKTGAVVPSAACRAAMSTLQRIRAENPSILTRLARTGAWPNAYLSEADYRYLVFLGLLDRFNRLPEEFVQVLVSAVEVSAGEPVIVNPIKK